MIRKIDIPGLSIAVCLAVTAGFGVTAVFAEEAAGTNPQTMQSEFTYSDDWAIVSAPPPPGPYNTVNLDPRIPGQEGNISPDMGMRMPPAISDDRIADEMVAAPPAAGQPAIEARPPARAARQTPYRAPPGYGYGRMPSRTRPAWSMTPHTRNYPPTGWGAGQGTGPEAVEEEVPPPPVYDRMIGTPPGPYGYGSGRY